MHQVLFVEDDPSLLASIAYVLEREGFAVTCAPDGRTALAAAAASPPDVVLLDVNLPDMDGFQVCQRLRRAPGTAKTPILFVTARAAVDDVVLGLEQLGDDYITKPFHPRVLVARIHAALRRRAGEPHAAPDVLRFEHLEVAPEARAVTVDGQLVALTKTEFDILLLFARHPEHVLTREAILDHVRADVEVTERTVDFQISGLRRKLGVAARHVETVRGVGYKFSG